MSKEAIRKIVFKQTMWKVYRRARKDEDYTNYKDALNAWIDEGSPVDIIYLDFQKTFDKVPHQRLLLKLKAHGIGGGIIDWIEQ